jgi:glycosyltransferase involved in cell wall biosynthesis
VHANPDSIAWGLGTLFADFEWGRWMGRNGRIAAETVFTWEAIADQTLAVYQN